MKILVACLISAVLMPLTAKAASSGGGGGESHTRISIGGYYGMAFISPSDINNKASQNVSTPKLNSLTSSTVYGGQLGFRLNHKFSIVGDYEVQNAKNPVNTTIPSVSGSGYELNVTTINAGLQYDLVHTGRLMVYLGGYAMIPTYSHVTETLSTKQEYDTEKNLGYMGDLGLGIMLGHHASLNFEAGYQSLSEGAIKTSTGTIMTYNGANAKMDLSGMRANAGLNFYF